VVPYVPLQGLGIASNPRFPRPIFVTRGTSGRQPHDSRADCAKMVSVTHEPPTSDLESEHAKFNSDVDTVRRYGALHPDDYVEEYFDNEPYIRLVVLMVGDNLSVHETALRELVRHPRQFEVRRTAFSRSQLQGILDDLNDVAARGQRAFLSRGISRGRVSVRLAADQEALAAGFYKRYGDAVELSVGAFPYPLGARSDDKEWRDPGSARPHLPLLPDGEFEVDLESEVVVSSGATVSGSLRVRNRGASVVVIETNGVVTARVIDPETGHPVGGFVGAQTAPLITFRIPPGDAVSIPLLVGTASSVRSLGYAIPPGRWAIEVPLQIEARGRFRTALLPILIRSVQGGS